MPQEQDRQLTGERIYSACDVVASLVVGVLGIMGLIAMAEKLAALLS
ncbi:hypothetical protein [Agrobacterium albertimagni]|nr:hypothetical protein [Agrobacterium albertimagni]